MASKITKEDWLRYTKTYRQKYPSRLLYRAARQRAKKRGIDFNLEYSDVTIPKYCPILNIPIVCHSGKGTPGGKPDSPSIDRIDNRGGYTKNNIQVVSHLANSMKSTATPEQLKAFATWVLKTYG